MTVVFISLIPEIILIFGNSVGNALPMRDFKADRGIIKHLVQLFHGGACLIEKSGVGNFNQQSADVS